MRLPVPLPPGSFHAKSPRFVVQSFAWAVVFGLGATAFVACGSDEDPKASVAPDSDAGVSDAASDTAVSNPGPACNVTPSGEALTVPTTRGVVRGKQSGKTHAFLGIPYTLPPVGPLRFKPPSPPACWEGTKDAASYGEQCPQLGSSSDTVAGSEDCLSLNVWAPDDAQPTSKLPVVFFIHGGANLAGASNQKLVGNLYDGRGFAENQGAVVVSINYRLGALGFLAHPSFGKENASGISGNYGILDQIAALTWVKENILAFGGDASRVMVFGESAGAYNTCALLAAPLAKGLFSSALMESGTCNAPTLKDAETSGVSFAQKLKCDGVPDIAACLRAAKPEDLVKGGGSLSVETSAPIDFAHTLNLPFGANTDGQILPDSPIAALRKGTYNKMPIVMGTNAHEIELFLPPGTPLNCFVYDSDLKSSMGAHADALKKLYPCNPVYPRDAAVAVATDLHFTCPTRRALRAVAASQTEASFRYYFTHSSSNAPLLRASHASELVYVFGTFESAGFLSTTAERTLSADMQGYWGRFAKNGNPNGNAAFAWPAYSATSDVAIELETTLAKRTDIQSAQCDLWDSLAIE